MAKLTIKTGKSVVPMRAEWGEPMMIREQTETQMPWVIANKMLVASNGDWILPYWQEYTFHFHVEMQARSESFVNKDGVKPEVPTRCDPVKMFSKENSDRLKALQEAATAAVMTRTTFARPSPGCSSPRIRARRGKNTERSTIPGLTCWKGR